MRVSATFIREEPTISKAAGIANRRGLISVFRWIVSAYFIPGDMGVGKPYCFCLLIYKSLAP
jgi:hypothetical protein